MKLNNIAALLAAGLFMLNTTAIFSQNNSKTNTPVKQNIIYAYGSGLSSEKNKTIEESLEVKTICLTNEMIDKKETDLSFNSLIFIQGIREINGKEDIKRWRNFINFAVKQKPRARIVMSSQAFSMFEKNLPDITKKKIIIKDPEIEKYSSFLTISKENMRRLIIYLSVKYLGRPGTIEPPEKYENRIFYYPEHEGTFSNAEEFFKWIQSRGLNINAPRALIETNMGHVTGMNQKVIDSLINEFKNQGILAAAINTIDEKYEQHMQDFKPDVLMVLTGKNGKLNFYINLGAIRMQPMFLIGESIDQWQSTGTITSSRMPGSMGMMFVTRESQGIIEPRVVAGNTSGKDFTKPSIPIPERVKSFIARAANYINLAKKLNKDKKIAIQYLAPPEKDEFFVGTEDTVYAESIIKLLKKMKKEGYSINKIPETQEELIALVKDHGYQIPSSASGELDKLVCSGNAALIPVDIYKTWFEEKLPKAQQEAVIKEWGQIPGKFMVWKDSQGKQFIVIPKIDFGNVILVPSQGPEIESMLDQNVRLAVLDRLKKDPYGVVPSHNQLAANFWIEKGFKTDALIVWDFLVMDYTLPRRTSSLSNADWPDILMGNMVNIRTWPICELNWSIAAKRRTCSVLVDHLTSPDAAAGLSDELLNLQNDIIKWDMMSEGALESKFRESITQQIKAVHLDTDMHLNLKNNQILTPDEVRETAAYLNDIQGQKISINNHILGQAPQDKMLISWITECLRSKFLEGLDKVITVPDQQKRLPGDRKKFLKQKGEEIINLVCNKMMSPSDAVIMAGGKISDNKMPDILIESFETAKVLYEGFKGVHKEIDNILTALNGRFVTPGPGNLPERNPSVLPTGRNMYIMNPEEIPSKPSWELGKQLVDQMLKEKLQANGHYPEKIGMSLDFRSTMMDYGVMEAQILYLIGVKPVWDTSNKVTDVELIPAKDLGRPRIDVFIETYDYYADYLESRLRLIDKAIRMVSELDEPDNNLAKNTKNIFKELQTGGVPQARAKVLSNARIFAPAPEQISFFHFLLLEETGKWDSRRELVDAYIAERDYAYTEGLWGEKTPEAYLNQLKGTDVVLKNITRGGPLAAAGYNGGNLCLVVKELTGQEPEYCISDLRNPGEETAAAAEDLLQKDFRSTLFNRKWIEGMMKEGYSGAQRIAGQVFSTFMWKTNRQNSISNDIWNDIVNVYVRDSKKLNMQEWFDKNNPHAFQNVAEKLLEAARKEYWNTDENTLMDVASAYAKSVIKYGHRESGESNEKLDAFLARTLINNKDGKALLWKYNQQKLIEQAATNQYQIEKVNKN